MFACETLCGVYEIGHAPDLQLDFCSQLPCPGANSRILGRTLPPEFLQLDNGLIRLVALKDEDAIAGAVAERK